MILTRIVSAPRAALSADPLLEHAYAYCARVTTVKARSFAFATHLLPPETRRTVYALYAFCRTVDDIADLPEPGAPIAAIRARLDDWRRWLHAGAPAADDPVRYALAHALTMHQVPLSPLLELLDALDDDLLPRHLPDAAALDHYCYGVAGTVGLVMAPLLGARGARALTAARDLGIAMQLTNVLRDVAEDLARGRVYLPAAEMARYSYTRRDLDQGIVDARFVGLMRQYIARARVYYARGMAGICLLPRESRLPIALAAHYYAAILAKIEDAGYDVFTRRACTGRRDKFTVALRLSLYHGATRVRDADDRHVISFVRRGERV